MLVKQCAMFQSNMLNEFETSMGFNANINLGLQCIYVLSTTKGYNFKLVLVRLTSYQI